MTGIDNVSDVGTVKAFAAHNEKVRGKQLLSGQHARACARNGCGTPILYPGPVYRDHGVAHSRNQVDKKPITMSFVEPNRIHHFAPKTVFLETTHGRRHVLRRKKQVQILRTTPDSCVDLECECA